MGLAGLLLVFPAMGQAAWNQPVGGASPINQASNQSASALSLTGIGGVPHVAWFEFDGTNNEIRVARLNAAGTAWQQPWTGVSPTSGGINHDPNQFAIGPSLTSIGGVPYVAWDEFDDTNFEMRVARLNAAGTAWSEPVGGANPINQSSSQHAFEASLTGVGDTPYIAWNESDGTDNEIRVARLNAAETDWEQPWTGVSATSGGIKEDTNQTAFGPSLTAIGGVPYIAWAEADAAGSDIRVARLNAAGTAWEQVVGGPSPINLSDDQFAVEPSLTAIGGVPYVAWREWDGNNDQIRVARLNPAGTAWEQVVGGAAPINHDPDQTGIEPSLTAIGGVPYVAWLEIDGTNVEIRVSRLNSAGTAWEELVGGESPINQSPTQVAFDQTLRGIGGVPYVSWDEPDGTSQKARVSRLEPEFLSSSASFSDTSATLVTDVKTYGLSYPVGFEFGPGLASSTSTAATSGEIDTITRTVTGLAPSATVDYRPFATAGVPAPRVRGGTQSFTTSPQNGPGPEGQPGAAGVQGPAGPQGPPGRNALVTCKVKAKKGTKPKVKCTVTYPSAGARRVGLELRQRGKVLATGDASPPESEIQLAPRRALKGGRFILRAVTVALDGSRHVARHQLGAS